nr:unnamed protein product [Digitaria exilis]
MYGSFTRCDDCALALDAIDPLTLRPEHMVAMHLSEKLAFQAAVGQSSRFDTEEEPGEFDQQRDDDGDDDDQGEGSVPFSPKIDELEKLLEAYFVQIDGTLNKLSTDYINIMLDDKQNQLLQMGVVLSTATLMASCAIVVTAVFGINIHIALFRTTNTNIFWFANAGMLGGAAALFVVAIAYYRKNGILR